MVHHFFELAGIELFRENFEHTARHCERIGRKLLRQFRPDVLGESLDMTLFGRCARPTPVLVIDAAHENRQLGGQFDRDFGRQAVTQGVKRGT